MKRSKKVRCLQVTVHSMEEEGGVSAGFDLDRRGICMAHLSEQVRRAPLATWVGSPAEQRCCALGLSSSSQQTAAVLIVLFDIPCVQDLLGLVHGKQA